MQFQYFPNCKYYPNKILIPLLMPNWYFLFPDITLSSCINKFSERPIAFVASTASYCGIGPNTYGTGTWISTFYLKKDSTFLRDWYLLRDNYLLFANVPLKLEASYVKVISLCPCRLKHD